MNNLKLIEKVSARCINSAANEDVLIQILDDHYNIVATELVLGSPSEIEEIVAKYINVIEYANVVERKGRIENIEPPFPATTIADTKELIGSPFNYSGLTLYLKISIPVNFESFPDQ